MYKILFTTLFLTYFGAKAQNEIVNLPVEHSIRAMDRSKNGTIWISGSQGAIYKNQGKNWIGKCPEEYQKFDFRGISVLSEDTLLAMSAGEGENGKAFLIKSIDGGKSWRKVFQDTTKGVFFDTIKFLNSREGWLLGDQINGNAYLKKTTDGGESWQTITINQVLNDGEASFAASNACIALYKNQVWFSTQNRIFHSSDKGKSWKVLETPFKKTATQGIFGIFFTDQNTGFAVGGDYQNENSETLQLAITKDGGISWKTENQQMGQGVSESVELLPGNRMIISGTKGINLKDLSDGNTSKITDGIFHVVKCYANHCIAAGSKGNTFFFEIH